MNNKYPKPLEKFLDSSTEGCYIENILKIYYYIYNI